MKHALAACAALAATLLARGACASETDPWFGRDKALHFGVSVLLSVSGYTASSLWLESRSERAVAGSAFSLTLGAGKELWDLAGHGDPSWRDFTWDVIGTSVGVALAVAGDTWLGSRRSSGVRANAQGLVLRF